MRKFSYAIIVIFTLAAFSRGEISFAQSNAVQKAFLNIKDQIEELVTAKDEKKSNELAVRIETMKKVINLSANEARDLKLKLLSVDRENIEDWRKKMIDKLNLIIRQHVEYEQELENQENVLNADTLKEFAETFKKWREENYSEVANQVREFLLIVEEEKSILTAQKRAQKIAEDIRRLEQAKIKGVAELKKYLSKANNLINEATAINKLAETNFSDHYILQKNSDLPGKTSTPELTQNEVSLPETQTDPNASTTTSTPPLTAEVPAPPPSIKDLVRSSLEKIKEAYRVFIEMSNLVRKLLE